MKKRICTLLSFIAMMFLMTSISTFAANGNKFTEGNWSYEVIDEAKKTVSIKLIDETQVTGDVTIPGSVNKGGTTYIVTSIGWRAFVDCKGLTHISIPGGVTSIDWRAFSGCNSLTSMTIPNSVTSIGPWAFDGCNSLTEIKVDANNTNYCADNGVLFSKDQTKLIQYPAGKKGTTYTIPDKVTSIGYGAFAGCSGLESVTIGNKVETIGAYAFEDCSGLTSVEIPNSVKSIGAYAFDGCSGLTSVTIPDSVKNIGDYAFAGCSGLTSVTIPDSVTEIGDNAFDGCSGLTSVTIPDSVTSIGAYAFSGCKSLKSVTIPDSVTRIGDDAFFGCNSLKSVTIGDKVTSIGYGVFYDCSGLTSVTIPDSVTSIGASAFYGCKSLKTVVIGNGVTSLDGFNFTNNTNLESVTIGNSVKSIGDGAFKGCSTLKSVTIPDSVTSIGDGAFKGCSTLKSVTIPDSVTSIGDDAFSGCNSLKSVTIPDSVTSIGAYAFSDCNSLKSVTIGDKVTSIKTWAFQRCSSLTSITIPNSVKSIGAGAFYGCSGLKTVFYNDGFDVSYTNIPATATKIVYKVTNEKTTPIEIKPTSVIWGTGVKSLTICSHLVGPHYKLVARNALTALLKGMSGLTITDTCEVCGAVNSDASTDVNAVNQNSPTSLQVEIKNMLGQNLNLIVEDPNGVLPEGTQLVAEWVQPGTERYTELSEMRDPTHEAENIAFLEITLLDKDGNILPMPLKDKVHVLLEIPNGFDKNDMQVALVKSDTDVEFSETIETIDGVDYISYWSDHFSPYAFVDTLSAEEKIALNNNSSSTSGTASAKATPKTGDNYIEFYIALSSLMVAAVALILLNRKKHCVK